MLTLTLLKEDQSESREGWPVYDVTWETEPLVICHNTNVPTDDNPPFGTSFKLASASYRVRVQEKDFFMLYDPEGITGSVFGDGQGWYLASLGGSGITFNTGLMASDGDVAGRGDALWYGASGCSFIPPDSASPLGIPYPFFRDSMGWIKRSSGSNARIVMYTYGLGAEYCSYPFGRVDVEEGGWTVYARNTLEPDETLKKIITELPINARWNDTPMQIIGVHTAENYNSQYDTWWSPYIEIVYRIPT